jgi:BirA family transcriptional regulator, biotin operon repressor / biotin---[acetyl-CoA-carboxylase] ligase
VFLTDKQKKLLSLLADGEFHSGTVLAENLAISRTAVCKNLTQLAETLDLTLLAVSGKGYRLDKAVELLNREKIITALNEQSRIFIQSLEIYQQIDSTNHYLVEQTRQQPTTGWVCLAEQQTAGKGRRGRTWVSPFGHNIYLSLAWQFPQGGVAALSGLSLAVGVAMMRALTAQGIHGINLKWPNDIYAQGKKLGGILIEVSGEADGSCNAVIGIGLNLFLPEAKAQSITQAWTDITQLTGQRPLFRNELAAGLLNQLLPVVAEFESLGLKSYLEEWRQYDGLTGRAATLFIGQKTIAGTVLGIDDNGLLLMQRHDGTVQAFASGEVSFSEVSVCSY